MSDVQATPPFVQWAIAVGCSLRDELRDWKRPEQVARQLRSLQAIAKARRDNRVFEGICVDCRPAQVDPADMRALGFRVDEVLEAYGLTANSIPCLECPANHADPVDPLHRLAECTGWLICDRPLREALNQELEDCRGPFPRTRPAWFQIWLDGELSNRQKRFQLSLFTQICETATVGESAHDYRRALERADRNNLPIHVDLCPSGYVLDNRWITPPHCSRCKASARSNDQRLCRVCRHPSQPTRERRRQVRGSRPYWPLRRFLGEEETRRFLARYQTSGRTETA